MWYSEFMLEPKVIQSREAETIQAKALWFKSLTVEERLDIFCEITEMALALHPELAQGTHVTPLPANTQVIRLP
jgi:hypothetical protein